MSLKQDRKPYMSKHHLANIRRLPSCVSWQSPCEAHHLCHGPAASERGVSMKATDRWAIPLTFVEHYQLHCLGSRRHAEWFEKRGIDAVALANALWAKRHDLPAMYRIVFDFYHDPARSYGEYADRASAHAESPAAGTSST